VTYTRRTVAADAVFEGLGLHSGEPVRVIVHPGEQGIRFNGVSARPENVSDTTRCTCLGEVSTIEHLMSALCGLEITDADVEVDGREMPGLDGSALGYVAGLSATGFSALGSAEAPDLFSVLHGRTPCI